MPDRYDPKFPARASGERKDSDKPEGQDAKAVDPLVELARIVSGRSGARADPREAGTPGDGDQPSAAPAKPQPVPSGSDLARDLEAELLNELQASFSMVPEVVGRPPPPEPPPPAPPPPAPTASPPEAPRAPRQPAAKDEVAPPRDIPPPAPPADPETAYRPPRPVSVDPTFAPPPSPAPQQATPPPSPTPQQAAAPPGSGGRQQPRTPPNQPAPDQGNENLEDWLTQPTPSKRATLADRIARATRGGEQAQRSRSERPAPPPPSERGAPLRPPTAGRRRDADDTDFPTAFAPNRPAGGPAAPPRRTRSRWEPPPESDPEPTIDASRFAPASGEAFRPPAGEAASPPGGLSEEAVLIGEAPADGEYGAVPGYGDDDLLAYPDDDLTGLEPPRPRRGPLAIAALIAFAVVGAILVIVLRSGGTSEPPQIITADASPTKITPETAGASDGDSQSKLIYDRVDPDSEIADSRLVVSDGTPVADIPPIPDDPSGNDVSRVILGGGPAVDSVMDEPASPATGAERQAGGTTVASSARETTPIGPKKVRTVVVRPDGTIVSSDAVAAEAEPSPAPADMPDTRETEEIIAGLPPASETPPAPAADENPLLSEDFAADVIGESAPEEAPASSPSVPDIRPPAPTAAPPPAARTPPPRPTVVATPGSSDGPIDVTPGTPAPTTSEGLGGGFLVQVSSQRSREIALATFSELQQRYPAILGDRAPDIQRADLGERGVYYRVRVGYPTREEAVQMCENLKAAGGDCLLATR